MQENPGKYRWTICGLVFFATTVNYLDRAVISLLKSTLEKDFAWTESDYANIVVAFQLCYAIGLLGAGRLIDRLGTRMGYALATTLWSLAAMGHGAVRSTAGFMVARGVLGITEAGNFPAAIKTIAEWFPKHERALATGILNSGTNIGALLAPLTVPFIAEQWGWRWAFILTGLTGFVWLVLWLIYYEIPSRQKRLSGEELLYIRKDPGDASEALPGALRIHTWRELLKRKQTWAFSLGKFLTDPVWWFYLFWLPDFLGKQYGLTRTAIALPVTVAYTLATAGSIFGGWLPMYLIRKGWTVQRSRSTSMLIYALCVVPVVTAQYLGDHSIWLAIFIIGLAMGAHQAWSANLFTTVSDMFPRSATASVTGIGGMFGALGGMLIAKGAGALFDHYKKTGDEQTGYLIMFLICSLAYVTAWLLIRVLTGSRNSVSPDS